jgi:pimeloyl-ACP methyl ester carboxylesterase
MRQSLIIVLLLFASIGKADLYDRDTYRIDSLLCPFRDRVEYKPGEIECGLLQVPENRENAASRYIELGFVKLNSTWGDGDADVENPGLAPGKRDDPVILLSGGPGSHIDFYVDMLYANRIRKHRDLYILEQRGIAGSGDFCANYLARKPEIRNVDSLEKFSEGMLTTADDCARNATAAGVDIAAYNTIENARDVRALRIALGFDKWNVWGISYGTILGQAYVKEDPEGILAVALDAIAPLDARGDVNAWRSLRWYGRALRKLDELCQSDDNCGGAFPDLFERVRQTARAAMEEPVSVQVRDTELFPSGKAYFLSDIAAMLPMALLYEESNFPALPAIIHAWADAFETRNEDVFKALAITSANSRGISWGMHNAIMCNDGNYEAQVASIAADRADFPVLTSATVVEGFAEAVAQRCIDLGAVPREQSEYALPETDLPALLIEGDMDPITPPPLAHAIEPGFSSSTYVEFQFAGHGPTRSVECAGDLLNSFYDDPSATPDLTCATEMQVPEFLGPLYRTSAIPRFIVLASEEKERVPGVAVTGGLSVLVVLVGFLVLTFAPLFRHLEGRKAVPAQGARLATWAAAFLGTVAVMIFAAAAGASFALSEALLLFGMVSWAWFGAWSGVLAGLTGLCALALSVRARIRSALPAATLVGFLVTGLAAMSLSAFLIYWGLGP